MPVSWLATALVMAAGCSAPGPTVLRVMTWNIAHGRGMAESQVGLPRADFEKNLAAISFALRLWQPNVVALQEADGPSFWSGGFDHVQSLADSSGLPHHFRGEHIDLGVSFMRVNCGTALLADRPLVAPKSYSFHTRGIDTKGFVYADVEFAGRVLRVASVHLHPSSPGERARQAQVLVDELAESPYPLLVLGDLNCAGDEEAMKTIVIGLRLNTYRVDAHDLPTFPSADPQLRIDWILHGPELVFKSHTVQCGPLSDHCVVIADLEWRR